MLLFSEAAGRFDSCLLYTSNMAIVAALRQGLSAGGLPSDTVQLIEDTARETALALMKLNQYVDVLIPRGGASLIRTVVTLSLIHIWPSICGSGPS